MRTRVDVAVLSRTLVYKERGSFFFWGIPDTYLTWVVKYDFVGLMIR
jgi:hypothetical protein